MGQVRIESDPRPWVRSQIADNGSGFAEGIRRYPAPVSYPLWAPNFPAGSPEKLYRDLIEEKIPRVGAA